MQMDFMNGFRQMHKAIDKEIEQRTWEVWLADRPHMEKFISFSQYLSKVKQHINADNSRVHKSKRDLNKLVDDIVEMDKKGALKKKSYD